MFRGLRFECTCFNEGWCFAGRGAFNGQPAFRFVEPTDELYEAVYGYKPSREEEDDDCCHMLAFDVPFARSIWSAKSRTLRAEKSFGS